MTHGHHVLVTQEDVRLAEVDAAGGAVELRRAQNDKEFVAVHLDLGTLVCEVRILDRQIVEVEGPLHLAQEVLVRLVQANPDKLAGLIRTAPMSSRSTSPTRWPSAYATQFTIALMGSPHRTEQQQATECKGYGKK